MISHTAFDVDVAIGHSCFDGKVIVVVGGGGRAYRVVVVNVEALDNIDIDIDIVVLRSEGNDDNWSSLRIIVYYVLY